MVNKMEKDKYMFILDIEHELLKKLDTYMGTKTEQKKLIQLFIEEKALIYTTISKQEMMECVYERVLKNEQLRLERMVENELYEEWKAYKGYQETQEIMVNTFVKEHESEYILINTQEMKKIVLDSLKECKKREEEIELSRNTIKKGLYAEWRNYAGNTTRQEELIEEFIKDNKQEYEAMTDQDMRQCIVNALKKEKLTEEIYKQLGRNNDESR